MKIAVVGGGAAGLTTAWLLDQTHEITLYDRENRLGGHAQTLNVDVDGQTIAVEAGVEFFSPAMFPTFKRLLQLLDVPVNPFEISATLFDARSGYSYLLPPFRGGRLYLDGLTPRKLLDMLRFLGVLRAANELMATRDKTITLAQFLNGLSVPENFKSRFMYPYLQAEWGVSRDLVETFSAYDGLRYSVLNKFEGLRAAPWDEIEGGTARYVQALADSLTHTRIRQDVAVQRICPVEGGYDVLDETGQHDQFDQVVLATNANQAAAIIAEMPDRAEMRRLLNGITYFETTIALHGDTRLMPPLKRHWSVVNLRYDGRYSQYSIWRPWKSAIPVFKSWVTHDPRLPDPLYAVVKYMHPQVDHAYFHAQEALQRHQGINNLWLAGMYMVDVDCHESAVMSGVNVARRLAPDSPRLRELTRTDSATVRP